MLSCGCVQWSPYSLRLSQWSLARWDSSKSFRVWPSRQGSAEEEEGEGDGAEQGGDGHSEGEVKDEKGYGGGYERG